LHPNTLDLHYVSLQDAVRLVEEDVTAWWVEVGVMQEMGERKALETMLSSRGREKGIKGA
jgi:hypothetical protein